MADEAESGGLEIHPMDQFTVKPLYGDGPLLWYTPSNVTLWMVLAILGATALLVLGTQKRADVPGRGQMTAELAYGLVRNMVESVAGKDGLKFFPYILTVFMFIALSNILGLIPASFTTTSHIAVTASLALTVFLTVTDCRFRQERDRFSQAVLDFGGAASSAARPGRDRAHVLLCPAGKPLNSSCREHDGRARND